MSIDCEKEIKSVRDAMEAQIHFNEVLMGNIQTMQKVIEKLSQGYAELNNRITGELTAKD